MYKMYKNKRKIRKNHFTPNRKIYIVVIGQKSLQVCMMYI